MTDALNVNELDFDLIKENLIEFLEAQSEFQDYDFTGSALNTLMDACSYVIHYVAVHSNFALRESFLESAQLRKNVSAIAKELGYFPSQVKASRANFKLSIDLTGEAQPASLTVPKGTTFVSTLQDGSSITFTTFNDNPLVDTGIAAGGAASEIWEGTVFVAQGVFASKFWTVTGNADQEFMINQERVDTDFLTVNVKPTQASTSTTSWTYGVNVTEVGPTTEAYFLNESGNFVEVYFGNDVIGKKPVSGNYIESEYLVTEGALGNGLKVFSLNNDIAGYSRSEFTVSNITTSTDGADRESVESIRKLAPLSYQRQNRIVTLEDYKTAVLENYSNVRAINAWGGENAEPPEFGKVFVSVAPVVGDFVSPTTKLSIEEDILKKFNVVGIIPEITDPEYLTINLNTTIKYRKDVTSLKASEIEAASLVAIDNYFAAAIFDYNQSFKYSKFLASVDAVDASINNSLATVTISKNFSVNSNVPTTYDLKMYNELDQDEGLESSVWTTTNASSAQIKSSPTIVNGVASLDFYLNGSISRTNIGTVDYTTGAISIPGFNASAASLGQIITVTVTPAKFDVDVKFNNLARLGTNVATAIGEVR